MKLRILFFACLLGLLCSFASAFAQGDESSNPLDPLVKKSKLLMGPVFGVNRNFHTGGYKVFDEPLCPPFENGTGWGFAAGFTVEFLAGETWSIVPRIMYETRPGLFVSEMPDVDVLVNSGNATQKVSQTVNLESSIKYNLATFDVLYKQEILPITNTLRLAGMLGPAVSAALGDNNRQVQNLVLPENAKFINPRSLPAENNGRTLVLRDSSIEQKSGIRFALRAGVLAEVGLFNNAIVMTPGVYYDYGLTKVTSAQNWSLNSFMILVDFRRAF